MVVNSDLAKPRW